MKPFAQGRSEPAESTRAELWSLVQLSGRLVEISGSAGSASLTLAFTLVIEAQRRADPVGWVTTSESFFYPPDAARCGVDIDALPVIRVPDFPAVPRAGEKLLRSGGFGLVVLDLGIVRIPMPLLSRLAALAQHHHAALVCLTEKTSDEISLGSLISLRVESRRARTGPGEFTWALEVLKDKRRGPTWAHIEVCHGPAGMH